MSEVGGDKNSNENCGRIYEQKKYFALALDPIHVGTGGYRIGRVDNTIVREPSTGIPKIPGTTIEGVCRSYAFLKARENGKLKDENENYKSNIHPLACAKGKRTKVNGEDKFPCGTCEICITFGYTSDAKSLQAMALFSDARILLFPVATMIGPVWVTCPMVLRDAGIKEMADNSEKDVPQPDNGKFIVPMFSDSESSAIEPPEDKLNFGWLLLEKDINNSKTIKTSSWIYKENNENNSVKFLKDVIPENVLKRIVIVPNDLFTTIVNSNLEVRTSVAIDPERGAAEEKALFTYEAIPRGTVLWFDVTFQNPKWFQINKIEGCNNGNLTKCVEETVKKGLSLFEFLGVGGMGSRGFGRLKVLNQDKGDANGGTE